MFNIFFSEVLLDIPNPEITELWISNVTLYYPLVWKYENNQVDLKMDTTAEYMNKKFRMELSFEEKELIEPIRKDYNSFSLGCYPLISLIPNYLHASNFVTY